MKNGLKKTATAVEGLSDGTGLQAQIEALAYHLWQASGGRHGDALNHWLQAEREILDRTTERRRTR